MQPVETNRELGIHPERDLQSFGKDTPDGYHWVTNIGLSGQYEGEGELSSDDYLTQLEERFGSDNVLVTEPAYDIDGHSWDGRAVHVKIAAWEAIREQG